MMCIRKRVIILQVIFLAFDGIFVQVSVNQVFIKKFMIMKRFSIVGSSKYPKPHEWVLQGPFELSKLQAVGGGG